MARSQAEEIAGRYTHDSGGDTVDAHRPLERARIPSQPVLPKAVADDDHRLLAHAILLFAKRPSQDRSHADCLKKVIANMLHVDLFGGRRIDRNGGRISVRDSQQTLEAVLLARQCAVEVCTYRRPDQLVSSRKRGNIAIDICRSFGESFIRPLNDSKGIGIMDRQRLQ